MFYEAEIASSTPSIMLSSYLNIPKHIRNNFPHIPLLLPTPQPVIP